MLLRDNIEILHIQKPSDNICFLLLVALSDVKIYKQSL